MRGLQYALIAGASCWLMSEAMEIAFAGRTASTLYLTAAFHGLMSVGIWGAYVGQRGLPSALSRAGAAMASLGYLVLILPPLLASRAPAFDIGAVMQSSPVFMAAGLLATVGVALFGIAVLRARAYARWIGVALVLCPTLFFAVMASGGLPAVEHIVNVVQSIAYIAMATAALGVRNVRAEVFLGGER